MNRTGLVSHPLYQEHDPGALHPESPARLKAIDAVLAATGLSGKIRAVSPRPATAEELGWVHTPAHIQRVARTEGKSVALDPDTSTSPESERSMPLIMLTRVDLPAPDLPVTATNSPGRACSEISSRAWMLPAGVW